MCRSLHLLEERTDVVIRAAAFRSAEIERLDRESGGFPGRAALGEPGAQVLVHHDLEGTAAPTAGVSTQ